ncbi:MAG: hypothetical protein KF901_30160 [Myxococcales bacterium]|nr:hypothetical protein [Myxococcales bacterium]
MRGRDSYFPVIATNRSALAGSSVAVEASLLSVLIGGETWRPPIGPLTSP